MTYKELQATIKEYKRQGFTDVKLNSSREVLESVLEKLTAPKKEECLNYKNLGVTVIQFNEKLHSNQMCTKQINSIDEIPRLINQGKLDNFVMKNYRVNLIVFMSNDDFEYYRGGLNRCLDGLNKVVKNEKKFNDYEQHYSSAVIVVSEDNEKIIFGTENDLELRLYGILNEENEKIIDEIIEHSKNSSKVAKEDIIDEIDHIVHLEKKNLITREKIINAYENNDNLNGCIYDVLQALDFNFTESSANEYLANCDPKYSTPHNNVAISYLKDNDPQYLIKEGNFDKVSDSLPHDLLTKPMLAELLLFDCIDNDLCDFMISNYDYHYDYQIAKQFKN